MASATATWSPSSLQLRLALNCRNCRNPCAVLRQCHFKKLNRSVRLRWVAPNGERPRNGRLSTRSDSTADTISGWNGSDNNGEQSTESPRKEWFGGIVGAGVAGVVVFTGLTFAALSLSKRSNSRPKQQMEPLTTEQEVLLESDYMGDKVEEDGDLGNSVNQDNSRLESKTGMDIVISSSSSEDIEVPSENKIASDNETPSMGDVNYASNGIDSIDNVSNRDDLQHESVSDDKSVSPNTILNSPNLPEPAVVVSFNMASKDSDGSLDASLPESTSEIAKENLVDVEPTNLSNPVDFSSDPVAHLQPILEPQVLHEDDMETIASPSTTENFENSENPLATGEESSSSLEMHYFKQNGYSETSIPASAIPFSNEKATYDHNETNSSSISESPTSGSSVSRTGIPAPSIISAALQVLPGKVLVPAIVDQVQGQALSALQALKVIDTDVQPSDLCARREYARWLVSASSALTRNTMSKVYPAMYIENITELAFDDITPEDPDFSSIQGLAEAGLISSKLSHRDLLGEGPEQFFFSPESSLSRQDLVSWKMALERRQLPEADRKILYQLSGFIDIDKINPDAWPALVADLSSGEEGIIALAFGCTRLFRPDKPVTKAQAAVALATGEAFVVVSEELARIEAESAADNAVSVHNALVAEVEKDINASFEKELFREREKIDAVEKMAEEARQELERLRAEREGDKIALMKERAAMESEIEILSKLRREVEEKLESLMSNKVEISYEKERVSKLRKEAEDGNQEIARLQYELEVERKALSMARTWAEDEAKRAREQAKALEEARHRWDKRGIKVVVDNDLSEDSEAAGTWINAGKKFSVEGTVSRAQILVEKLKAMANDVRGKSGEIVDTIIQKIILLISNLKELASKAGRRAAELQATTITKARGSVQELQQSTAELRSALSDGAKRVAGDCREGVEKITQRFKT